MAERGDIFSEPKNIPLNATEIIGSREIETFVREKVAALEGEELVKSIVEYIVLTLIEFDFSRDPNPKPLQQIPGERLEKVKDLTDILPDH
jgi:hypothetical protein